MDGTQSSNGKIKREPPSPEVEATFQRLCDIGLHGAEPWNDPVEKRRESRRHDLHILRASAVESAVRLNEAMGGRMPPHECPMFGNMRDPIASLASLNRSVVQIVLAEEQLDETTEERTARIVAEAEARVKAEYEAAAARARAETLVRRSENRRHVQHTVHQIALRGISLTFSERERLLGGLFADLDKDDTGYDRDPAELIAELTARLGLAPKLSPAGKADMMERRKQQIAVARDHLDVLRGPHEIDGDCDGDDESSSAPRARAQGPPH
jgi:hypothetical protein